MDLQKERESFDEWHYNQYLLENLNIDISNAKYIYDYAHKNVLVCQLRESHFTAWQAAKAKAQEAKAVQECAWLQNEDGYFDTSCSQSFVFSEPDDRPHAHQFTYCCFCGGKLIEVQVQANG